MLQLLRGVEGACGKAFQVMEERLESSFETNAFGFGLEHCFENALLLSCTGAEHACLCRRG